MFVVFYRNTYIICVCHTFPLICEFIEDFHIRMENTMIINCIFDSYLSKYSICKSNKIKVKVEI